ISPNRGVFFQQTNGEFFDALARRFGARLQPLGQRRVDRQGDVTVSHASMIPPSPFVVNRAGL
ncbi:hypothetical protein NL365_27540, partial [Klebsiella pneumoniae]|nr:hypothetical protein [Klebsiella pneumoniae]